MVSAPSGANSPRFWVRAFLSRNCGRSGDLRQQRFLLGRGQGVVKMQQMLLPVPGKVLLRLCVIHMLFSFPKKQLLSLFPPL